MRITRLRIGDFREGGELRLALDSKPESDPALSFLVGPNGAGKSRVLEAVGRIFSHLSAGLPPGMDFDLEYELGGKAVLITTQEPAEVAPGLSSRRLRRVGAWLLVAEGGVERWRAEHIQDTWPSNLDALLPRRVLGLSTGPASRLDWALRRSVLETAAQRLDPAWADAAPAEVDPDEWNTYVASEQKMLSNELRRIGEEPRCIALSGEELRLAMLALLSHPKATAGRDEIRDHVLGLAGLDATESLRAFTFEIAADWRERLPESLHRGFEGMIERASRRVEIESSASAAADDSAEPDHRVVFELASGLTRWIGASADTPLIWFDRLLRWRSSGAIRSLRLVLKKRGHAGLLLDDDFSDGEILMAGRYGLLLLLRGHEDCLVLFDEPETHFNDRWKVDLVYDLARLLAGNAAHVMIASHSDLTLSDADRTDVHVLECGDQDEVPGHPPVSPFAAGREEITTQVFRAAGGSGRHAVEIVDEALESGDPERMREILERVGPGFHRFRLQYALREHDRDAP